MQVAEILSDLTSLRACVCISKLSPNPWLTNSQDHNDALSLVTVNERTASREGVSQSQPASAVAETKTQNNDLRRAKELVELHYEIKAKHAGGSVDQELVQAREEVNRVLRELEILT